jgi:hypothetical protein
MVSDAVSTLVVTQGRTAVWRPTRLWYEGTWGGTRAFAIRAPAKAAEVALDVYPAVSLIGLLVVWLAGLLFGWALIYWGLHGRFFTTREHRCSLRHLAPRTARAFDC